MMNVISDSEDRYMIMLDEPLRGTNITDKQLGTRAIAEKLIRMRALGIIATHDTILCSLEESSGGIIRNFHFESTVVQDTLSFDYRLKPGGSTSNNATILMQQMGII